MKELMAIRLKYAEIEAAAARGENVDEALGAGEEAAGKKKEKEETLRRVDELMKGCRRVTKDWVDGLTQFSRSQLYRWRRGKQLERKARGTEGGGRSHGGERSGGGGAVSALRRAQGAGLHALSRARVHRHARLRPHQAQREAAALAGSVAARDPARREFYEHVRAQKDGEIWAEDFTDVTVEGRTFKAAVLLDMYDSITWAGGG